MSDHDENGGTAALAALYRATSYSIISTEVILRAEKRPLLGELPARHKDALHALVRLAALIPTLWPCPKQISHHALSALNALERTSPLKHTAFGVLVPLVLAMPCLFAKSAGPARPTHLAKQITLQVLRANLTRALLVANVSDCTSEPMDDGTEKEGVKPDLENLLSIMKELRRGNLDTDNLNANQVWEEVKSQCHTFLRCCCMLFYFLSDIIPSEELTIFGGDTWEALCGYLDLPTTFKELIDNSEIKSKVSEWAALSTEWFEGNIPLKIALEPKDPPRLIPLPDDFSELMNEVSEFSCPNSEREDSKYPTMCLICGQILCSQSYCCQIEVKKVSIL